MIPSRLTIPLFSAAAMMVTFLEPREARADVKHVVLSSPAGAEVTERLRAELVLKGFRVSMFGPLPSGCFGDDLLNVAKGADAAVCVDDSVHVFVRKDDKLPHTDTVASVDASDIAAMRAAEIVRVRLELAGMPDPPAPPPPPPQEIVIRLEDHPTDLDAITDLPKAPPPQVRLGVGAGALYDGGAQPADASYAVTGLTLVYRPSKVPGLQPIATGTLVSNLSGLKAGTISGGVRYRLIEDTSTRLSLYFGPNIGAFVNRDVYNSTTHSASRASAFLGLESAIEFALTDETSLGLTGGGAFLLDENAAMRAPVVATLGVHTAL